MEIDAFLRAFLATYFVLIALFYGAKQAALTARDGDDRVHPGADGTPQRTGRKIFNVLRVAILLVAIGRAGTTSLDPWLGAFPSLAIAPVGLTGVALIVIGTWIVLYSHNYMGALWRSGVPEMEDDRTPALLQTGPFARTRNPIFLGVQIAQVGLVLAFPSAFTLLCLGAGVLILRRQVNLEEEDLRRRFGPSYLAYVARTPRWV